MSCPLWVREAILALLAVSSGRVSRRDMDPWMDGGAPEIASTPDTDGAGLLPLLWETGTLVVLGFKLGSAGEASAGQRRASHARRRTLVLVLRPTLVRVGLNDRRARHIQMA